MDISPQASQGTCTNKCALTYDYQSSKLVATHQGMFFSLAYDEQVTPPVTFNQTQYTVTSIQLMAPSIHTYQHKPADAELLVHHTPVLGGNSLLLSSPLYSSTDTTSGTAPVQSIIDALAQAVPAQGDSAVLPVSVSLQTIVPMKPYYMYTNQSLSEVWIVFDRVSGIPLPHDTLATLATLLQPYTITLTGDNNNALFFNAEGPNANNTNDGLYISCQPTGPGVGAPLQASSGNRITTSSSSSSSMASFLSSSTFLGIVLTVGCLLVLALCHFVYNHFVALYKGQRNQ